MLRFMNVGNRIEYALLLLIYVE